ncbi:MAG: hypothetical protein ACYTG6_06855 [Planctomycetota bacterium]|jgi:hypothetical protein
MENYGDQGYTTGAPHKEAPPPPAAFAYQKRPAIDEVPMKPPLQSQPAPFGFDH